MVNNLKISANCVNLIKKFEGCSLSSYRCPKGVLTIGYGHTGNDVKENTKITQEEATELLRKDLNIHSKNVLKLVKKKLTQNQFDALVSFEYNIGYGNFSSSTLLKLINLGNFKKASEEFLRWNKCNGKILNGLTKRRKAEQELFLK